MGLSKRGGNYMRRVRLGKRTIKDGEACLIWNRLGQSKLVVGPSLEYLFFANIQFLDRKVALKDQYLEIYFSNGKTEIMNGPCSIYLNPVVHDNIFVRDALQLESELHVALVSEQQSNAREHQGQNIEKSDSTFNPHEFTQNVDLRLVHGPRRLIPTSSQKFITFFGQSQVLYLGQQTIRHECDAMTSDGNAVSVDAALTFRVAEVQKYIQSNQNPKEILLNSLAGDIRQCISTIKSSKFIESEGVISSVSVAIENFGSESHPKLAKCAKSLGIEIISIQCHSFGGFERQIAERLTMLLSRQQALEDIEVKEKIAKKQYQFEMENASIRHQIEEEKTEKEIALANMKLDDAFRRNKEHQVFVMDTLTQLQSLGVDLTRFLVRDQTNNGQSIKNLLDELINRI